jgi:hypothetical protein
MSHDELLKRLEGIFEDAERTHLFGSTEIEWRGGKPVIIREIKTNRLDQGENPNHDNTHRH